MNLQQSQDKDINPSTFEQNAQPQFEKRESAEGGLQAISHAAILLSLVSLLLYFLLSNGIANFLALITRLFTKLVKYGVGT